MKEEINYGEKTGKHKHMETIQHANRKSVGQQINERGN